MAGKFSAILTAAFLGSNSDQLEIISAVQRGSDGFSDNDWLAIGGFAIRLVPAREYQLALRQLGSVCRKNATAAPKQLHLQISSCASHSQPAGTTSRNVQRPIAEKRVIISDRSGNARKEQSGNKKTIKKQSGEFHSGLIRQNQFDFKEKDQQRI